MAQNENKFLSAHWDQPEASTYPPAYGFGRKGDLLLRVTYSTSVRDGLILQAGLLNIYHLAEDTWRDPDLDQRIAITGSKG